MDEGVKWGMKRFLINGSYLARRLSGIERFCHLVISNLDKIAGEGELFLLVPKGITPPPLKRIKVVLSRYASKSFPIWDHVIFLGYSLLYKAIPLSFCNTAPLLYPGVAFLHDIYFKLYPRDALSLHDKLIALYSRLMYFNIAHRSKLLFTVSKASASEIAKAYGCPPDKIVVVGNGWEHFKDIKGDESVFKDLPGIKSAHYYFTLGSLQRRKNLSWIKDYARAHPEATFVISGKPISGFTTKGLKNIESVKNIIFAGYLTDAKVKALFMGARAFVFPSYYEGFGIPPLESLSVGTPIVVADIPVMREVYGDAAHYIDAKNPNCDLENILSSPVAPPDNVLSRYTYEEAAKILYEALKRL